MKLFFCFGKKIKNSQKINYKTNSKNTVINPIYNEEEELPPPKIKLNRKSKEEYCTDAIEFLKELDLFLDTS
jgi:hypothetical protein